MKRLPKLVVLVALLVASLGGGRSLAAQGTPAATGGAGQLVVADVAAHKLYVYGLDDFALDATLDGVTIATHAGLLMLPDGRLLFVDEGTQELVALRLAGEDGPEVVGRVPVPPAVSHFAVNPALTHAVVGASDAQRPLTLVDLTSYTSRPLTVEAGEAGVMIGDDPLTLFHRNDVLKQVESYPVEGIVRGSTTPTGVVDTGAAGHGEAISHELRRLYLATDDGLDVVEIVPTGLDYRTTLPWDVSGRSGGRAYFVRLAADGRHLFSYMAERGGEETPWETWRNDAYVADLETDQATRVELGSGLVYRFALSDPYALFFNMHPEGDNAHLLDVDPASPSFGTIVATIPLTPLTQGPKAGESPWEAESRIAAITPDGSIGFVSHGGDGRISVIDTAARRVSRQLEVPTSLAGGGYMLVVQEGMSFADTIAR